jgi:hypothetical protein
MKYQFTIKVPVYNFNCRVIIADDIEIHVNKLRKKLELEEIEGLIHGYAMCGNDVHTYYLFYQSEGLTINTIAHEVSHIIDYVFTDREIEPEGEPRAYITGYLTSEIVERTFKKQLITDKWLKPKSNPLSTNLPMNNG